MRLSEANPGDEVFANGIFHFNISKILSDIKDGSIKFQSETILLEDWFRKNLRPSNLDEKHLLKVDISRPILLAEISPARYSIIDGNHRIEKAFREGKRSIKCYKVSSRQLLDYFTDKTGYLSYLDYWNGKVRDLR
jgi:hypothetical protein